MKPLHKKLVSTGIWCAVAGLLLSLAGPLLNAVAFRALGTANMPLQLDLATLLTHLLLAAAQYFLLPFGAVLTALGAALHWREKLGDA